MDEVKAAPVAEGLLLSERAEVISCKLSTPATQPSPSLQKQ